MTDCDECHAAPHDPCCSRYQPQELGDRAVRNIRWDLKHLAEMEPEAATCQATGWLKDLRYSRDLHDLAVVLLDMEFTPSSTQFAARHSWHMERSQYISEVVSELLMLWPEQTRS